MLRAHAQGFHFGRMQESAIYRQDQLADGLAILEQPMRFSCLCEREHAIDSWFEPTGLHPFKYRSSTAEDFFVRVDEIPEAASGNGNRFGH